MLCHFFLVLAISFLYLPNTQACSNPADCRVAGDFNRAIIMDLQRSYNTPSPSSSSASSSRGDSLSNALAGSFKQWEASKDAESAAAEARFNAWAEAALKKPITRFTDEEIKNDHRNVLIFGAEEGRAIRQNQLGVALLNGSSGFPVNVELGLYWLKKAAAQGDYNAFQNLANILTEGMPGIKADPVVGLKMFELYINSSKLTDIEKANFLMDKTIEVYKKNDSLLTQAIEASINANKLKVDYAPAVIFKLVLLNPPHNSQLKELLDAPTNPFLVAAKAHALANGLFGFAKDKTKGQELFKEEAKLGHQPSLDYIKFAKCMHDTKIEAEKEKKCMPLSKLLIL